MYRISSPSLLSFWAVIITALPAPSEAELQLLSRYSCLRQAYASIPEPVKASIHQPDALLPPPPPAPSRDRSSPLRQPGHSQKPIAGRVSAESADRPTPHFLSRVAKSRLLTRGLPMSQAATATPADPHLATNTQGSVVLAGTTMKVVELVMAQRAHGWSPEELHFQFP